MSTASEHRPTRGKIFNRSNNNLILGPYGGGFGHGIAVTLFSPEWNVNKEWVFVPMDGGFYTIEAADTINLPPEYHLAMTRAKNPKNPYAEDDWWRYSDPCAMTCFTNNPLTESDQKWIIKYVARQDVHAVVTIHPWNDQDKVLARGEKGTHGYLWYGTALRTTRPEAPEEEQWLVPAGVVPVGHFTVSSGNRVRLTCGGEAGHPGVEVQAKGDGDVPPQTVVVTLPQGVHFTSSDWLSVDFNYRDGKHDTHGYQGIRGTLADGRETLTVKNVSLALSGKNLKSFVGFDVEVSKDAPLPLGKPTVQIGDQTAPAPIEGVPAPTGVDDQTPIPAPTGVDDQTPVSAPIIVIED